MFENSLNISESISNKNVERILALLKEGDEKIDLGSHQDVVLVLGNTGSGKTAFAHFVAGNNDDLISTEVGQKTGEFIISDINNKINVNSTVISKTAFPEIVIDKETNTTFIDCPGFNDSRNESYDIATAYFINKVLLQAKNVKIVCVISYQSLIRSVNRTDFLELLQHITTLINNIEKYADSIALVATKVDNTFHFKGKVPVLITDNAIVENIAQFLYEVKESLKIMTNEEFFLQANALLDTFLQKNGTEYTKLGIFRRPNKKGKLSSISFLQNGKKTIKKILRDNLKYLPIDKKDIGYTVSDKSKNIIRYLVEEINKNIAVDISFIKNDLIDYYKELESNTYNDDIYRLINDLKIAQNALSKISNIAESANIDDMVNLMSENFTVMNVRISKSRLSDIANFSTFINFLQNSAKKFEPSAYKLVKGLQDAVNYVDNSLKWYHFLATLHDRLSEYDIQKNSKNYDILNFETKNNVIFPTDFGNFFEFFEIISNVNFLKKNTYTEIRNIYLDVTKIKYFKRLIDSTLKTKVMYDYSNGQSLQITGEYIVMSKVQQNTGNFGNKSVQIFAKHTVFIDADLSNDNDISIIAPRWHIIGSREINLNGNAAAQHNPSKASNGLCEGCNGQNGLPGKPGTSGGHFFGIGDVFENACNLTINAVGGTGGPGQHGGDGMKGQNGKALYPTSGRWLRCEKDHECTTEVTYTKSGLFWLNVQANVQYTIYGTPGERGGNSGRGGIGGIGGEKGTVSIIGSNDVSTNIHGGESGPSGVHGDCGQGGKGGSNVYRYYDFGTWYEGSEKEKHLGDAADGERGECLSSSSSYNEDERREPLKKDFLYPSHLTVSDYKNHLVENLGNCFKKRLCQNFYEDLQSKPELQKYVYDAKILFRELQKIDRYFHEFTSDTSRKLYNILLEKVVETAKETKSENNMEEYKSLKNLLVILFGKGIRLKSNSDNLIFNFKSYIDSFKSSDVNEIRHFHANVLDERVSQLVQFIESAILDDINNVIDHIDDKIVTSQQNVTNSIMDDLSKRKAFGGLRTSAQYLHLAGSLAKADFAIINKKIIKGVFPSVYPFVHFEAEEISFKDQSVKGLVKDVDNFIWINVHKVEDVISIISKERKSLQKLGNLDEICDELQSIEKELNSQKYVSAKSYLIDNAVKNALQRVNNINAALMLEVQHKDDVQKVIQKYQNAMRIYSFDPEMFHEINESASESLIIATDHVHDTTPIWENVRKLSEVIIPSLQVIQTGLTKNVYKPTNQSGTRKMIQETLDDITMIIYTMIDQVQDLHPYVEKINETVNALFSIYDSLHVYEDKVRFNLLYHHVENSTNVETGAYNYKNVILSDLLLYEYEQLVEMFKRKAFPFQIFHSNNSLQHFMLNGNQDIENLKTAICNEIEILVQKLNESELSSETVVQDFFNRTSSAGSFYVWTNDLYRETIWKLLRGKEIYLNAFVNENYPRNMIKFYSVQLKFQSKNNTVHELLEKELKNFSVRMTHSGTSYFAFCNHVNLFNSVPTSFDYNFNESSINVEPVLSPYTTWTFKLFPINANVSIRSLEPFRQQLIDLHLEGRAKYMNVQNRSVCDEFEKRISIPDYSNLKTNTIRDTESEEDVTTIIIDSENQEYTNLTEDQEGLGSTIISNRKCRDVDSSSDYADFVTDKNSFSESLNPFNSLLGSEGSSDDQPDFTSLEWNSESSSANTYQPSFNMNATLALVDYLVRKVTKIKPYFSQSSRNLYQVHPNALDIMDKFETILEKLSHEYDLPLSQLLPDPIQLMSLLESELVNGNKYSIKKVLLDSVTAVDPNVRDILDQELTQLFDSTNHSNPNDWTYQNKEDGPSGDGNIEFAFSDGKSAGDSDYEFNGTFFFPN